MTLKAVILDSREPDWVKSLTFDVPVTVQALPTGDAWLAVEDATIIVERKTLPDLLGSIVDGRLFDQASRMVQASPWCYCVITGMPSIRSDCLFVDGRMTNWSWNSVQGATATLQELGVVVLWRPTGYEAYRETLEWLARHNRGPIMLRQKRETVMQSPAEIVLSALPGISDGRADALMRHCGSAAFALQYLTGEGGGTVPGVGPGTKQAARKALGLPEDLQLAVISKEEAA